MKANHSESNYLDGESSSFGAAKSSSKTSSEIHHFLEDIEDLITQATSLSGDDLVRAKEKISAKVNDAKKSLEAIGDSLASRARKSVAMTDDYVHEQPWSAIAAGAAVGLIIGFLVARRA